MTSRSKPMLSKAAKTPAKREMKKCDIIHSDQRMELPFISCQDPGNAITENPQRKLLSCGVGLAIYAAFVQDQDSSEEEEDGDNEYDLTDKFIAREDEDDEDGEGGDSDGEREAKRRHKRRREKSAELDEEDYQLLEDNQVTVRTLGGTDTRQSV